MTGGPSFCNHCATSASNSPEARLRKLSPSFRPHPNLSDEVNRDIVQSEIEGGVRLEDLQPGSRLQVTTRNTRYQLVVLKENMALMTGHPLYCPRSEERRVG